MIISIDIVDKITVIKAGRQEADVITGANIKIENGLIIPPVRNNKKPNCKVSKSKNKNALILLIDLFFLSEKYEQKFTMTESKIINNVSNKGISILIINVTKKIAKICPKIAIHLIFIRLPSKIVFIKN